MEEAQVRNPVVAGQFYPASAAALRKQIERFLPEKTEKQVVIACMMPHAGYVYSGRVAVEVASAINIPDTVILLGPNHTGYGKQFSIMTGGLWRTPLGGLPVDTELARGILARSKYLEEDACAHENEHSLEVELPILQYFRKDFSIVPIAVSSEDPGVLGTIGDDLASVIGERKQKKSILIVASSDMTHYEPQESAESKDTEAIGAILELDEQKLTRNVRRLGITMCGYAPVVIMLRAAKALGAKQAKLVKYQTSGDISGDYENVVGYAGITIF
jgi:AmmeMemoRadiSam system protein B